MSSTLKPFMNFVPASSFSQTPPSLDDAFGWILNEGRTFHRDIFCFHRREQTSSRVYRHSCLERLCFETCLYSFPTYNFIIT